MKLPFTPLVLALFSFSALAQSQGEFKAEKLYVGKKCSLEIGTLKVSPVRSVIAYKVRFAQYESRVLTTEKFKMTYQSEGAKFDYQVKKVSVRGQTIENEQSDNVRGIKKDKLKLTIIEDSSGVSGLELKLDTLYSSVRTELTLDEMNNPFVSTYYLGKLLLSIPSQTDWKREIKCDGLKEGAASSQIVTMYEGFFDFAKKDGMLLHGCAQGCQALDAVNAVVKIDIQEIKDQLEISRPGTTRGWSSRQALNNWISGSICKDFLKGEGASGDNTSTQLCRFSDGSMVESKGVWDYLKQKNVLINE